jgi:hypothetical protein
MGLSKAVFGRSRSTGISTYVFRIAWVSFISQVDEHSVLVSPRTKGNASRHPKQRVGVRG